MVIQAMRAGGSLLIDEISLAGDAVLERLNSILETERKLVVSERTRLGGEVYEITASEGFTVFATMNPGGDYGKKEVKLLIIFIPSLISSFKYVLYSIHSFLLL